MTQYMGTVNGNRGVASRLGTKSSGLLTKCNGWNLGATCRIVHNETMQRDEISVFITTGTNGRGVSKFLGTFSVNSEGKITKTKTPR